VTDSEGPSGTLELPIGTSDFWHTIMAFSLYPVLLEQGLRKEDSHLERIGDLGNLPYYVVPIEAF
jgi:hypothetical protein